MSVYVDQSMPFEVTFNMGIPNMVGTIEMMLVDGQGGTAIPSSAVGFVESPAASGIYIATRIAPATVGQYDAVASWDGSYDPATVAVEDVVVVDSVPAPPPPVIPPSPLGPPEPGPCTAWTTAEAVAACCSADVGTDLTVLNDGIIIASQLLYELSGRRYTGGCDQTVRPCGVGCGFWQVLSRGHLVLDPFAYGWRGNGWWWEGQRSCGCEPLSTVDLAGYPVREIVEVKIDGAVVDPSTYRLDEWHKLVRLGGLMWPACQDMGAPDTETGTFSVRYLYGINPPPSGVAAANELACQLYLRCVNSDQCQLPDGVTRVTRQGLTFERPAFISWAHQGGQSRSLVYGWHTGLTAVDAFLNAMNPSGLRRRPAIASPDVTPYAPNVGT